MHASFALRVGRWSPPRTQRHALMRYAASCTSATCRPVQSCPIGRRPAKARAVSTAPGRKRRARSRAPLPRCAAPSTPMPPLMCRAPPCGAAATPPGRCAGIPAGNAAHRACSARDPAASGTRLRLCAAQARPAAPARSAGSGRGLRCRAAPASAPRHRSLRPGRLTSARLCLALARVYR